MQTMIVYLIGLVAVGYFVMIIRRKIKGQGSCCSSGGGCSGCGAAHKSK